MSLQHFNEPSFDQDVIASDLPAVVDFTATWCGPCKQLAPVVEELAGTYAGKVKIGKLDVDESPGIAMKYGVRSVPTLLFFKGGEVVDEVRGAVGREVLESKLKTAFALSA